MDIDQKEKILPKLVAGIQKARKQFGDEIIADTRLMGLLLDFRAFEGKPWSGHITRMLLEQEVLRPLMAVAQKKDKKALENVLHSYITNMHHQFGFAKPKLESDVASFLVGIGCEN